MSNKRLIARLDVKGPNLIKGVQLEGLRKIGDPQEYAKKYYEQGADEIIYLDIVASLYGRNNLVDIVSHTAEHVFVPITAGGGIRSIDDVRQLLRAGADKIAINTAALNNPDLIRQVAETFGSQCMVLSIEAKKTSQGKWEAYAESGREHSYKDAVEWAQEAVELGAGEILLTSIDTEGSAKGFDYDLVKAVTDVVNVPVIASGGMGSPKDLVKVAKESHADAIAFAHVLHYDKYAISDIRKYALEHGVQVRND